MIADSGSGANTQDVTFDHLDVTAVASATSSGPQQQFAVTNSDIGPFDSCQDSSVEDLVHLRNVNATISGNFIHDLTQSGCGSHADGIQDMGMSNLTITGNTFQRDWSEAIIAKTDFGASKVVFDNNTILDPINGDGTTPYSVGFFGATYTGAALTGEIKNNCVRSTSHQHIDVDTTSNIDATSTTVTTSGDSVVVSGNLFGGC